MAKEIPFFKFYVGEWANGDITAESFEIQGIFINLCSIYWTKEGNLSLRFATKKFGENAINELYDSDIIDIHSDKIHISFLDEQLKECEGIRKAASEAGKASAAARAKRKAERKENETSTTVERPLNETSTLRQPIREEKKEKREEKKRILEEYEVLFSQFWDLYAKKVDREKCFKKWLKLSQEEIRQVFNHVEKYVESTPDKKYRKNPLSYLNAKSFENEIIENSGNQGNQAKGVSTRTRESIEKSELGGNQNFDFSQY